MSDIENMSRDELRRIAEQSDWFHAIDFGDFSSSGRFPKGMPQNITLFAAMEFLSAMDLEGKRVLDIGSSDGLASFGMKALGAADVVSIDSYDIRGYRLARKLLELETDYRPGVQIKDAVKELGWKQFDVILCAGVIYHMLNPMSAFAECRKLLKDDGVLIMESPVNANLREPVLTLNTEDKNFLAEAYTYWVPTKSAMEGMMKLVGFDVVATRFLKTPTRYTVLDRATARNQINNRSEILERVHNVDFCDFDFQFKQLDEYHGRSEISISTLAPHRVIDAAKEKPPFPFQPDVSTEGLGKTRWISKNRNY